MTRRHLLLTLCAAACLSAPGLVSADPANGERLHQMHCQQCHDSQVYTRENHFVTSMPGLESQVRRCEQNIGLKMFDDEVQDVVDYLDQHFYHFTKPATP